MQDHQPHRRQELTSQIGPSPPWPDLTPWDVVASRQQRAADRPHRRQGKEGKGGCHPTPPCAGWEPELKPSPHLGRAGALPIAALPKRRGADEDATPNGDAEDEPPTTTGSRRKPKPPHARRALPPPSSGAGFAQRTPPAAAGGGSSAGGGQGRRS
jgi:hypothetical protein